MKRFNQKGIAPLMIVLLVAVIGVVGFAAYTVGQKNAQKDKPDSSKQEQVGVSSTKWIDRSENKFFKEYANDSRFVIVSDGEEDNYREIYYKNDKYSYQFHFFPGFYGQGGGQSLDPTDKFVSESDDKTKLVFRTGGFDVEVLASKAEGQPSFDKCRTEEVENKLSKEGFTENDYVDGEVSRVPARVYLSLKPGVQAKVGEAAKPGEAIIVVSRPYKNYCYNVVYSGESESLGNFSFNDPFLGPATRLVPVDQ